MVTHAKIEKSDGNGFPGGVRLSWAALSALIGTIGLVSAAVGVVRWADIRAIDLQVASASAKAAEVEARREADVRAVRGELDVLRVEIRNRLDRMEIKMDRAIERQR
jgi:hypothetical protein